MHLFYFRQLPQQLPMSMTLSMYVFLRGSTTRQRLNTISCSYQIQNLKINCFHEKNLNCCWIRSYISSQANLVSTIILAIPMSQCKLMHERRVTCSHNMDESGATREKSHQYYLELCSTNSLAPKCNTRHVVTF